MRDATLRKERATFLKELTYILVNVGDDKNYFKRLLWANEYVAHQLSSFEFDAVYEEESEEE